MMLTLAYLYFDFSKWRQNKLEAMKSHRLLLAIRDCLHSSSISMHKPGLNYLNNAPALRYLDQCSSLLQLPVAKGAATVKLLCETSSYHSYSVEPKFILSLNGWTRYLANTSQLNAAELSRGNAVYIFLELFKYSLEDERSDPLSIVTETKLEDLVKLVAWRSGLPFQVVAECTEKGFLELVRAFTENALVTEEKLQVTSITSVNIQGLPEDLIPNKSPMRSAESQKGNVHSKNASPSKSVIGSDDGTPPAGQKFSFLHQVGQMQGEDFSETCSDSDCAGEAPADPLEDLAPEMLTPITRKANLQGKPPNVLIYCGKRDSARLYENVRAIFTQCLNTDRYTIYHLKHDQVKTTPWLDNTILLIISSDKVYDGVDDVFLRYFLGGGTIVSFSSLFDDKFVERVQTNSKHGLTTLCYQHWNDATFICGRHVYERTLCCRLYDVVLTSVATEKQNGCHVIVEAAHEISGGVALLSQVNLDKDPSEMAISVDIFTILKQSNACRFEILRSLFKRLGMDSERPALPPLTPIFLIATDLANKQLFLNSLASRLKDGQLISKDVTLHLINDDSDTSRLTVTSNTIPVLTEMKDSVISFNYATYKANLKTTVLGNILFYADVIPTTMNLFEGLMFSVPQETGLIAIARRQTAGQGRGGNAWLSPPGCAMFSVHVRVLVTTRLGERISFLQHIMSLAIVLAIRQKPGYEDIDLRIKWPNDIYFGTNLKLGGILVKSSIMYNMIHANIGCGINVTNKDPTLCINDLIQVVNENAPSGSEKLDLVTVEEVIARSVTLLEELISTFQANGPEYFQKLYCQYWLHSNQSIRLNAEDGPEATVIGLDDYGYLLVRMSGGRTESLQPDGNSFDMMKNLVAPKNTR